MNIPRPPIGNPFDFRVWRASSPMRNPLRPGSWRPAPIVPSCPPRPPQDGMLRRLKDYLEIVRGTVKLGAAIDRRRPNRGSLLGLVAGALLCIGLEQIAA